MHKFWPKKIVKFAKIFGLLAVYLYFMYLCFSNYSAEINSVKAQAMLKNLQLSKALLYANNAIELNPLEPNYYRIRARVYTNFLMYEREKVSDLKKAIITDLETAYIVNPINLVTMRNIVPLYYFVAAKNVSLPASQENIDSEFIKQAQYYYKYIKDYSPNDVGIYTLLAKYEKRLNLMNEYEVSVAKVRELRPDLLEWYESFR